MCYSVRGGAMGAPKVQVITGKKGIPLIIRDTEPFHIELWESEAGIEFFDNYYLAFSFMGGLFVGSLISQYILPSSLKGLANSIRDRSRSTSSMRRP
jgi:hypothetical protein